MDNFGGLKKQKRIIFGADDKKKVSKNAVIASDDSMQSDSDLEFEFKLDQYKEVSFTVRFDQTNIVDEIV